MVTSDSEVVCAGIRPVGHGEPVRQLMENTNREIQVRLFAVARELAGRNEVTLAAEEGLTALALRRLLAVAHPELGPVLSRCAVAVNHRFAQDDDRVVPGDEVAIIPPVAGG